MTAATTAAGDGSGVRRFVPPPRAAVDPQVFAHPVFAGLRDVHDLLASPEWPSIAALETRLTLPGKHLVEQDAALLADGLHYEARIAQGRIATRADNWHDLFNALVWARYPQLKQVLNVQQCRHIASMPPGQRNRAQAALTQFDETGVIVRVRDEDVLAAWDVHDWPALFEPARWQSGDIASPDPEGGPQPAGTAGCNRNPVTGVFPEKGPSGPFVVSGASCFHAGQSRHPTKRSRQAVSDKATDIANLLAPTVVSLGLELLGVEYLPAPGGATLRLYIDVPLAEQPERIINVDDCERVSREVSAQLDVEDPISGNYTLEVSSPGVDRPLFNLEQFARHQGESAKVTLKLPQDNRRRLQGRIEATDEAAGTITFIVDKTEVVVSADNIDKARIMPDWVALGLAPSKPTGPAPKRPKPNTNSSSNEPAAKKPRAE